MTRLRAIVWLFGKRIQSKWRGYTLVPKLLSEPVSISIRGIKGVRVKL